MDTVTAHRVTELQQFLSIIAQAVAPDVELPRVPALHAPVLSAAPSIEGSISLAGLVPTVPEPAWVDALGKEVKALQDRLSEVLPHHEWQVPPTLAALHAEVEGLRVLRDSWSQLQLEQRTLSADSEQLLQALAELEARYDARGSELVAERAARIELESLRHAIGPTVEPTPSAPGAADRAALMQQLRASEEALQAAQASAQNSAEQSAAKLTAVLIELAAVQTQAIADATLTAETQAQLRQETSALKGDLAALRSDHEHAVDLQAKERIEASTLTEKIASLSAELQVSSELWIHERTALSEALVKARSEREESATKLPAVLSEFAALQARAVADATLAGKTEALLRQETIALRGDFAGLRSELAQAVDLHTEVSAEAGVLAEQVASLSQQTHANSELWADERTALCAALASARSEQDEANQMVGIALEELDELKEQLARSKQANESSATSHRAAEQIQSQSLLELERTSGELQAAQYEAKELQAAQYESKALIGHLGQQLDAALLALAAAGANTHPTPQDVAPPSVSNAGTKHPAPVDVRSTSVPPPQVKWQSAALISAPAPAALIDPQEREQEGARDALLAAGFEQQQARVYFAAIPWNGRKFPTAIRVGPAPAHVNTADRGVGQFAASLALREVLQAAAGP